MDVGRDETAGVWLLDVTLHIGAHRTGTTTLQKFLGHNGVALTRANTAYWGPDRTRSGLFGGMFRHPAHLSRASMARAIRSTGVIQIGLQRLENAGFDRLIVSEENMLGGLKDNIRNTSLYSYAADRMEGFRRAFAGRNLTIALSIRSYETFWASAFAFALLRGLPVPSEAQLDCLVTQPSRWTSIVEKLIDLYPDARFVVWPFESFVGHSDKQLALLMPGQTVSNLRQNCLWHNASPSRDKLRRILADRGDAQEAIKEGSDKWQPFSADHISAMKDQYARDLDWFANKAPASVRFAADPMSVENLHYDGEGQAKNDWIERCVG